MMGPVISAQRFLAALKRNWGLVLVLVLCVTWIVVIQWLFQNGLQG